MNFFELSRYRKQDVYLLLLLLFGLVYPIYSWAGTWCLLLISIFWMFRKFEYQAFLKKNNYLHWPFLLYFLLHVLGMIYSEDQQSGLVDLESKASLLIVPLIISTVSFSGMDLRKIIKYFVIGTAIANVIYLSFGIYQYQILGETWESMHGVNLTRPFKQHPAYISSYNILAVLFYLNSIFERKKIKELVLEIIGLLFTWYMILNFAARMQIFVLIIVGSIFIVWNFSKSNRVFQGLLFAIGFGAVTFFTAHSMSFTKNRMNSTTNLSSGNSYELRWKLWKLGFDVYKENPLIGVGTGDSKLALLKRYEEASFVPGLKSGLNSHSQYIQSLVTLGIFGLLSYLCLLGIPMYRALKVGNIFIVCFLLIFTLSTLTECMLESHRGSVWLAVFGSLFWGREDLLNE